MQKHAINNYLVPMDTYMAIELPKNADTETLDFTLATPWDKFSAMLDAEVEHSVSEKFVS